MIRNGNRFGLFSLACGLLACVAFAALSRIDRLHQIKGGNLLAVFNWLGLVKEERSYIVEMKPSSVLALNDANAVLWLGWLACACVFANAVLSLHAESRREETLYLAAGFAIATAGIGFLNPLAMVAVQLMGWFALLVVRRFSGSQI